MALKLGLKKASLSSIESGNRSVQDRHIRMAEMQCRINPDYIKQGDLPMFLEDDPEYVGRVAAEYNLSPTARRAIETFATLPPETQRTVYELIAQLAGVQPPPVEDFEHVPSARYLNCDCLKKKA